MTINKMKLYKKRVKIISSLLMMIFLSACNQGGNDSVDTRDGKREISEEKQINITILLDLSDRINPEKYPNSPEHFERDIAIVNHFTEFFKRDMSSKGAFNAKGKIQVIFTPKPEDPKLNEIASNLIVDLSNLKVPKDKKVHFDSISRRFSESLNKIYSSTIKEGYYPGSDIWRFFKNDVDISCIEDSKKYRNILVILSDGYVYHKNSNYTNSNRTSSLLPDFMSKKGLRNDNWKDVFDKNDFGYIAHENTDLSDLEILVLEINPSKNNLNDEDVIKAYLNKWFIEMKAKPNSFKFYNTDLPEYTYKKIDKFLAQ